MFFPHFLSYFLEAYILSWLVENCVKCKYLTDFIYSTDLKNAACFRCDIKQILQFLLVVCCPNRVKGGVYQMCMEAQA